MTLFSKKRPAIAMIELIFALVIMGIVLMSAPQLVSQAMKSGYTSTQQELIAAATSHMSLVLSRHWDENNTAGIDRAKVLGTTTSATLGLDANASTHARFGTPIQSTNGGHRLFFDSIAGESNASLVTAFGQKGEDTAPNTYDDIDDYNNVSVKMTSSTRNPAGDYIDTNLSIDTVVRYLKSKPTGGTDYNSSVNLLKYSDPFKTSTLTTGTSDIKRVTITLLRERANSAELDANITLNAFSCNIGSYAFEERSF